MKRYASYKASRVEWLGDVPEHWGPVCNKVAFQEVDDASRPTAHFDQNQHGTSLCRKSTQAGGLGNGRLGDVSGPAQNFALAS